MEILQSFNEITDKYSVNLNKVVIAGYSGGAMASLNLACNSNIQLAGVIALCPGETEETGLGKLNRVKTNGTKFYIFEGELSGEVEYQQKLIVNLIKLDIKCNLQIIRGIGHRIPDEIENLSLSAIKYFGLI